MSYSADPRHLFELQQVLSVGSSHLTNDSHDMSGHQTICDDGLTIRAFEVSKCGRALVFIAGSNASQYAVLGSLCPPLPEPPPSQTQAKDDDLCDQFLMGHQRHQQQQQQPLGVHWVPWYEDADLKLTCLTFSPDNQHCLLGCKNGTIFVAETGTLCPGFRPPPSTKHDESEREGSRDWTMGKTLVAVNNGQSTSSRRIFGSLGSSEPSAVANASAPATSASGNVPSSRCFNPTTLNWWTTNQEVERSYALVGTQAGCVLIVDLIDGKEIGFVRLSQEPIVRMETMSDPSGDNTYLFITDAESKQWRVLLERRSTSYVWCGSGTARVGSNKGPRSRSPIQDHQRRSSSDVDNSTTGGDSEELSTPMRSRFAGIRNMSVASLASLRQKLSEGKKMLDRRVNSSGGVGEGGCPDGSSPLGARVGCSGDATNIEAPEPLSKKIGGTRLFVQHQGGGSNIEPVLGGLFPDTSILTFHNSELEVLPQTAFRLPRCSEQVLVLDKVMLASRSGGDGINSTGWSGDEIKVISSAHAEIPLDQQGNKTSDPVLQGFALSPNEKVIGMRRGPENLTTAAASTSSMSEQSQDGVQEPSSPVGLGGKVSDRTNEDVFSTSSYNEDPTNHHQMSDPKANFARSVKKRVTATKRRSSNSFQDCWVITNLGIYSLRLFRDPVTAFLEAATQCDVKSAERVAATFGLAAKDLLELAADIRLSERDFSGAIALYRLSGCKHLKAVLKFAASGHVPELLWYLTVLTKQPNLDVSLSDKIHLANLTLMAYFQQTLVCKTEQQTGSCTATSASSPSDGPDSIPTASEPTSLAQKQEELHLRIRNFLDDSVWIDESLAIRLAIETREWGLLRHLCTKRGLLYPMLEALVSVFTKALEASVKAGAETASRRPDYYTKSSSASSTPSSLSDIVAKVVSDLAPSQRRGIIACLTDSDLLACSQANHDLAVDYLEILKGLLPLLTHEQMVSTSELCWPTRPALLPTMKPYILRAPAAPAVQASSDSSSFPSQLLHFCLTLELTLLRQSRCTAIPSNEEGEPTPSHHHLPGLVGWVTQHPKRTNHQRLRSKLRAVGQQCVVACGPSHVMLNKSNVLFSWGLGQFGVLAHHGITKVSSRFASPRPVELFSKINKSDQVPAECPEDLTGDDTTSLTSSVDEDDIEKEDESFTKTMGKINVISVACGKSHSMALTDAGLYVWGCSRHGQLGLGGERVSAKQPELVTALVRRVIISVAAGHYHSAALDSHGQVWTWGWGVHGQLGTGDIEDEHWPKPVLSGGIQEEGGCVRVVAGHAHTLVSTVSGNVWVFGCGLFGQLGNGSNKKSTVPLKVDFSLAVDGRGVGDVIDLVACGYFHNYALSADKQRLYTWGCNPQLLRIEAQQKKRERMESMKRADSEEEQHHPPSNNNSKDDAPVDGRKEEGLGGGPASEDMLHLVPSLLDMSVIEGSIEAIACGNQHTVILTSMGTVYTFGRNVDGQLGIGSRREEKIPTMVHALQDESIVQIGAGGEYTMALSRRGTLFAWGSNASGQLGKPPMEDGGKGGGGGKGGTSGGGAQDFAMINGKLVALSKARNMVLKHSLQNSCDVPKPVAGLRDPTLFSSETCSPSRLRKTTVSRLTAYSDSVKALKVLKRRQRRQRGSDESQDQSKPVHVLLETFHPYLNPKAALKQCLTVLDSSGHPTGLSQAPDLQSAAKVSLLCAKSDNVTKAFEFSLQSIVRQSDSEVPLTKKSSQVFRAYSFYLHCSARGGTSSRAEKQSLVRRQLTERLVTCWQDLKFSFLHLEKLIVKEKDPVIFQVLVLTLFCPQSASSPDGTPESSSSTTIKLGSNKVEDDIIEAPVGGLGHDRDDGPRLVDLFTPEFCLKIGDAFVNSIRNDDDDDEEDTGDGGEAKGAKEAGGRGGSDKIGREKAVVSRWLERQRSTDNSFANVTDAKEDPEDATLSKNLNELVTGLIDADRGSSPECTSD